MTAGDACPSGPVRSEPLPGLVAGRALVVMRPALTIALTNHKGGCGKTTSTANLGAAFAERGLRVLLVDADPQANLSEAFAVPADRRGLEHALDGAETVEPYEVLAGLHVLPAGEALAGVIADRAHEGEFAYALADLVDVWRPDYSVIVLDTPPERVGPLSTGVGAHPQGQRRRRHAHRPPAELPGLPCQRAPGAHVTGIKDGRTRSGVRANGGKVGV